QPQSETPTSWRQQPWDHGYSPSEQQGPRAEQFDSQMQQDSREPSRFDGGARGYDNGRYSFAYNQSGNGNGEASRYRRSTFQGDREVPSRSRRGFQDEDNWQKKKDFKSRDREKHGRGFITDEKSIEEEMRYTIAAKKASKPEAASEPRKPPEVYLPE